MRDAEGDRRLAQGGGQDHEHRGHEHGHDHGDHHHHHGATPLRRLAWAFVITAGFMVVEASVGLWSGSLALVADAGHMLADAAALGLAMIAQRIAAQARTRARTFGFRRAEVLAAFANGIALGLTAIWIFIEAASRWSSPPSIRAEAVAITAGLGLLVNVSSAVILSSGEGGQNVNTRAALAHVLSDALGSVGAMVSAGLILGFGWTRADATISFAIGALILWSGWRLVRDTSHVLMEGTPAEMDLHDVEETIRATPGVAELHDLHVWSISEGYDVLTVHVVIAPGHHGIEVADAVNRRMREVHGLTHCTVQPEAPRDERLVPLRTPHAHPRDGSNTESTG